MKTIERIETFDGEIHPSFREAQKHLEELMGEILSPMARTLAQLGKFKDTLAFLESNVEAFRQIVRIRDDMKMEESEQ